MWITVVASRGTRGTIGGLLFTTLKISYGEKTSIEVLVVEGFVGLELGGVRARMGECHASGADRAV